MSNNIEKLFVRGFIKFLNKRMLEKNSEELEGKKR